MKHVSGLSYPRAGEPEYVCINSCLSFVKEPTIPLWPEKATSGVADLHGNGECQDEMEGALFLLLKIGWNRSVPRHSSNGPASSPILELAGCARHLQLLCRLKLTKDLPEVP